MSMKKTHDVVFAGEKYTDRNGEEKTRFVNVGALFARDDGSMCIKLESIPVGFTGWLNCYEPRPRDSEPRQPSKPVPDCLQPDQGNAGGGFADDDIPFASLGKHSHWIA